MGKYRTLSSKNKYYLPKEDYLTAIHYSLRYPLWLAELEDARDTAGAIRYDKDNVQTSVNKNTVEDAAIKAMKISEKIQLIDDTISKCANGLDYYLKFGVCYGFTFEQLKGKGLPCERDAYYLMRRHYYFELIKKI